MKLRGKRVTIRPSKKEDLDAMAQWRPFADPLYRPFDFPRKTKRENERWFTWRSKDPSRRMYTIRDEKRQVIGSLTLRDIAGRKSARLGITVGADFVSQGYGTEAMRLFFDYYFETMGFAQLVLDVAATNLRAVRSYRSLGFRYSGKHYRPAGHSAYRILRRNPRYQHVQRYFRRQGAIHEVLFYDMVLTRAEWQMRQIHKRAPEG